MSTTSKTDLQVAQVANRALLDTLSLIAQTVAGSEDHLARMIYRLAKDAGAVDVGVRCVPGCEQFHSREQSAKILNVSYATMARLEQKGLQVSRKSGNPLYKHTWLNEFMEH